MAVSTEDEQILENKEMYWLSETLLTRLISEYQRIIEAGQLPDDQKGFLSDALLMANYLHLRCYPKPYPLKETNLQEIDAVKAEKLKKTVKGLIGILGMSAVAMLAEDATFEVRTGTAWNREQGFNSVNVVYFHLNQLLDPNFGKEEVQD